MKTSEAWWAETKNDKTKLDSWLVRQYVGEMSAVDRINRFLSHNPVVTEEQSDVLKIIVKQEETHAGWIKGLLIARDIAIPDSISKAEHRYWSEVIPVLDSTPQSFIAAMAAAALAEKMRLQRIQVIAKEPNDLGEVFQAILKDEVFHAKWFLSQVTEADVQAAQAAHEAGMLKIGLIIPSEVL